MAAAKHDVVVIGGGHNGLTAAAYLTKAGVDVCVLEKQDKVGGGAVTWELSLPGFKHDPAASVIQPLLLTNPLIYNDELGLKSKYGLKIIVPSDIQSAIVFSDGRALILYRDIDKTCKSIEQFSKRDAEVYPKFCEASAKALKAGLANYFSPPPSFGTFVSFLEASEEGRELLRVILGSAQDVVEDWFECEQMKILLYSMANEVDLGPREGGGAIYAFGFPLIHQVGLPLPEGGAGALSEALAACIHDNGGTIRVSSSVKAVKIEAGEAIGVVLDSSEEIIAKKAIVSSVNVKQLFLEMLKPEEQPADFQTKVRRLRHKEGANMSVVYALNEAPKYKAGGDVNRAVQIFISPSIEEYLRVCEGYTYGTPSARMPLVAVQTILDPTRAPEGKHTMRIYHREPYDLKEGSPGMWDEIKQDVADGMLATLRKHTTNMGPENILERYILSPLDIEREFPAMLHGDGSHISSCLSQKFGNRPMIGWGHYRTPVKKLYMCGPSTYPGGSVICGSRAAVQVIMEDLGIDFKKVVAK